MFFFGDRGFNIWAVMYNRKWPVYGRKLKDDRIKPAGEIF